MASPQTANPDGATVPCKTHANLLKACERADTDAIARELSEYCDLNVRDHDGQTLLMVTAHRGSVGMVKQLLLHSADPNVCDGGGVDALSLAAAGCHDDVVGILLDFGAMADRPDAQGTTPLMRVAACTSNAALRTVDDGAPAGGSYVLGHGRRSSEVWECFVPRSSASADHKSNRSSLNAR
jgi:ankyrin repeat protein